MNGVCPPLVTHIVNKRERKYEQIGNSVWLRAFERKFNWTQDKSFH